MSHEEFGKALGLSGRGRPIAWEREENPDHPHPGTIAILAEITGYPPAAFGGSEEAELVRETLVRRLERLEDQADGVLLVLRSLLGGLAERDIRIQLPPEAVEFLATAPVSKRGDL